ncbi:excinuclease ABC subunit UvrC [Sulfurivirga sp.]|uniref:excinuclease ABC subunit UvrC n=1 Tax=Sulfurivirga sp. TaxID=2614236 RepID=UPI0025EE884A|nr:excinuclease ABC subunit UvrC [Sulfurivirga sp.]
MSRDFDLKAFLKQLPQRPGVYQMLDAQDRIIYVGKAKNLKRRVSSYFSKRHDSIKTARLVAQIARIEVILTDTEAEALLLENTLIKRHNPRYNVLFRDDKSYPYIRINASHDYPGIYFHRGARRKGNEYYGPFPNAAAVYETIQTLQKIFRVRPCKDSVFANRSRACLQYQINRCSAPCVGMISKEDYARDLDRVRRFLAGESHALIEELGRQMEQAAEALEFERAAQLRDQIAALRSVQHQHAISHGGDQRDVIAVAESGGLWCVALMRYQQDALWDSRTFFPKGEAAHADEVLEQFVVQFYEGRYPRTLLVDVEGDGVLAELRDAGVPLRRPRGATERALLELARTNAQAALKQQMIQRSTQQDKLARLQALLRLPSLPQVMECFDISHTQGGETVASCVRFVDGVPDKRHYRRYNIREAAPGDDYAAIHEAVFRHYRRLVRQPDSLPDLVLIDGGRGQLARAQQALDEVGLSLPLVSVAKGEGRKAGLEKLHLPGEVEPIDLPPDDPALHVVNFIRDEAHRFAIAGHRARRAKRVLSSGLEQIEGVGPKTRRKLLTHFGGLKGVEAASVQELMKVPGISRRLAERIYRHFHGEIE